MALYVGVGMVECSLRMRYLKVQLVLAAADKDESHTGS